MSRQKQSTWRHDPPVLVIAIIAAVVLGLGSVAAFAEPQPGLPPEQAPGTFTLPAARAVPATIDTLLIGGYARGTFREALNVIASDLSETEREMVGRHLDRIFEPVVQGALDKGGRLKVAYERVRRPDGTTRSIQVLAAQAAVGGGLHTLFFYEHGDKPGYYDDVGQSLDPKAWAGPLSVMRVTSGFNMHRMHPILHRVLPHNGIDYAAGYGTPVYATADGSVSYAAVRGGYGNMVEVQHPNGYAARYAHLSRSAVREYQPVRQGDVIGYVGATGLATGPHLHYEVRRKGQPVDPAVAMAYEATAERVDYDLAWRNERRALGRLLARTPTVIRRN
ncbi:MAG TPA: M23 family metallopeptidase [Longimicrobium sp.]|nr:M23 family metallopeptidase [Longimicrobium sp.]